MGRRKTGKILSCTFCGSKIYVPGYKLASDTRHYCNAICFKYDGKLLLTCLICKEKFLVNKGVARRRKLLSKFDELFCSHKCANVRHKQDLKVKCEVCDKKFRRTKGQQRHERTFCSPECTNIGIRGEDNHGWNPRIVGSSRKERRASAARRRHQKKRWSSFMERVEQQPDNIREKLLERMEDVIDMKIKYLDLHNQLKGGK